MSTKVKICCISSIEEANLANKYGANIIGLVGDMPSGPGIISDKLIAEIVNQLPYKTDSFLLTSKTNAHEIIKHHQKVNTTTIQIVDSLEIGSYQIIKKALSEVQIVQVIHVLDQNSISEAISISKYVNAILLDSGNPNLKIKELGGTGRTHNWDISKEIVKQVDIPVYLAGGLNSDNVAKAIRQVKPYGVDLCSGVRTDGNLDEIKLKAFFEAVKSTYTKS